MKITFSPAGTQDTYIIEGDFNELQHMLDSIIGSKPSKSFSQKTPKLEKLDTEDQNKVSRFLDSVYLYPADNETFTGKGRFIADMLSDMKPHSYSELERKSNAVTKTVDKNITKLRNAGAVIEVVSNTVCMVSFPDKKAYVKKRRSASKTTAPIKVTKKSNTLPALTGLKLS
jgi:hypothetical protein